MLFTQRMIIPVQQALEHCWLCQEPATDVPRDQAIFDREVVFPNGFRFAVQIVSSTQPHLDPCWTQGVLFDADGFELACTDVGEDFLGEYIVEYGGDTYEVVVATDMHTKYWDGVCPDCGESIDLFAVDGEECGNCGHVFWSGGTDETENREEGSEEVVSSS